MSMLDKITPSNHSYGINKDQTFQNENQLNFVLNGIKDSSDGGKRQYRSEPGNELSAYLPSNHRLIGWIYGSDNEIYLFSTSNNQDAIGVFKKGKYSGLATLDCLNFSQNHIITGEFRIRNGCERILYWSDGYNPDYWFNVDRPELFLDDLGNWDCNKFKFSPNIQIPKMELVNVNDSGGFIPLGSYYFQIEILDKNLNSIYKTDISPQTVVVDESLSGSYTDIDGGLNAPQYDPEFGGVPITTKSITLNLFNLDTSFDFIRINVARQIAGTQALDAHAIGQLIPINSDTIEFTYSGYFPENGDYPLDYTEMLINNIVYDSAYIQEQVQGRLVRANLKQDARDYSNYQRSASAVKSRWVAKEVLAKEIENGNPKDPTTYWSGTSFQSDEVYAIGVRYLHRDGMWSPVFHIPGRSANITAGDNLLLDVVPNNTPGPLAPLLVWRSDVEHIPESEFDFWAGDYENSQIRKWKVRNTASISSTSTVDGRTHYVGEMGYYECENTYPEITDCDGNLIWGEDYDANEINTFTKIRHHKFPDRRLVPHFKDDQYILPLGIQFLNVEYPNTDVIGHQFCYVKRTDANKTVLDSGWFHKSYDNINLLLVNDLSQLGLSLVYPYTSLQFNVGSNPGIIHGTYGRYCSGSMLFSNKLFNGSYLKTNNIYRSSNDPKGTEEFSKDGGGSIEISYIHLQNDTFANTNRTNYKINKQLFVEPNALLLTNNLQVAVRNGDPFSPENIIETEYEIENVADVLGNPASTNFDSIYSYKKILNKPYESLFTLSYNYLNFNPVSTSDLASNTFYNGDSIISLPHPIKMFNIAWSNSTPLLFVNVAYNTFYEEHEINYSLKHGGLNQNKTYKLNADFNWCLDKVATATENGAFILKPLNQISSEFYKVNPDYYRQCRDYIKSVIPFTYNYCSRCLNEYPNRIIFSPRSFDEESFDLYRINKVNDYIDIPAHRGKITGLKYHNNLLLVMCEDSTFLIQPNPQVLQTDSATAYLTTGDFLSLPPGELVQNDVGYAGMQSKQNQCNTPFGHCWIDQKRGGIYIFNGKIDVLSNKGLTQWFVENIPSEMQDLYYVELDDHYPNITTVSPVGVGMHMYYDPRFKRLFVTKKDFLPIGFTDRFVETDDLIYNTVQGVFQYQNSNGDPVTVDPSDPDYFENKSWTMSYSFEDDLWISWHSYRPTLAFWDDLNYYTLNNELFESGPFSFYADVIYKHLHNNNFQTYYGSKKDFIIDWTVFTPETKRLYGVQYLGYSLQWNNTLKQWTEIPNATFNKGVFYNNTQSSGLVNLIYQNQNTSPYANATVTNQNKYVIRADQVYRISNLFDVATNYPVMSSDWNDVKTYGDYIDHVPYAPNLDFSKSPYQMGSLWDKFINVRLYFKPENDIQKVIILSTTNETLSVR